MIFHMCIKVAMSEKRFSHVITINRPVPRRVHIKGSYERKAIFPNKNEFSHVISKNRTFPRKVDIKQVMSQKRYYKIKMILQVYCVLL